ncbi:MAG: hypothetical protein KME07_17090 [Pegethrix bostrychoides GSE-TBD4-15B]|uniref:Uncharacterized protein n=1 Tax=Pegethrix bostrychoides GSE-TBD4-15B TaxID=2839662 RepID=A0A951U5U2_9CYAN|nr:hypothetical protein [Pegethrix bostrychoides GSE-TBD4-15B]
MKKIPPTFCWTKMGAEAGEELAAIIRRKEWERQLGGGYFFWGIGQSLGENAKVVAPEITSLHVIFSPMPSKPKLIDVAPNDVVIWNAWIDAQGVVRRLPIHCFITSRAFLPSGRKKESHYALVCFSDQELDKQSNEIFIFPNHLRNVATNKPLGASQVTAIVRALNLKDKTSDTKHYSVSFTAELRSPYCVQLAQPLLLDVEELIEIKEITNSGDIGLWNALVKSIRSRMTEQINWVQCTLDFFDEDDLSFTDSLSLLQHSEYSNV